MAFGLERKIMKTLRGRRKKKRESFDMCGRTWTFFPFFISKKNTNLQMAKGKTEPLIEWPPSVKFGRFVTFDT